MSAYILMGLIALVGAIVQGKLKSKFEKYSRIPLRNGMTGKQIAEKMLNDNDIFNVRVVSVRGRLTDHYNPLDKTINLSESVYSQVNVAAAAVAAHECGHAIQHAVGYRWLKFRSMIVPMVSISSKLAQWILLAGIFMVQTFPQLLLFGIILFAATVVFSFITLPVEYDASNRALKWLEDVKILDYNEHQAAEDALKWAARTYVVAAVSSLVTLLYYLNIYNSRR
jgi:Zn-dependent membrane protease YugP